ncbi:MAG: DUF748 domain-containing protein, partial [Phycisphaerales bacterium]|nr:DUF748 domain-containing protein [Phycisphaerales bacterium]
TVFGFFGVPIVLRSYIMPKFAERIDGSIAYERAHFNPFTLYLSIDQLNVRDAAGDDVAGFERFEVNLQALSTLFRDGSHLRECVLTRPFLHAVIRPDGSLNLAALILPPAEPTPTSPDDAWNRIPRIVIEHAGIVGAELSFRDNHLPEPFELNLDDLTVMMDDLDTTPGTKSNATFIARTDAGDRISWSGTVDAQPLSSEGTVTVERMGLTRFMPYAVDRTEARLTDGTMSTTIAYDFAPLASPPRMAATITDTRIEDVSISMLDAPLLAVPGITMDSAHLDAVEQHVVVHAIVINDSEAQLLRNVEGDITLTRIWKSTETGGTSSAETTPDSGTLEATQFPIERIVAGLEFLYADLLAPWSCDVEHVALHDGLAAFTDDAVSTPTTFQMNGLELELGPLRAAEGYTLPFTMRGTLDDQTSISADGRIKNAEDLLTVNVTIDSFPLPHAQPYLPDQLVAAWPPSRIETGTAVVRGDLTVRRGADDLTGGAWNGTTTVQHVIIRPTAGGDALLEIAELTLDGTTTVASPIKDGTGTIRFDGAMHAQSLRGDLPADTPWQAEVGSLDTAGVIDISFTHTEDFSVAFDGTCDAASTTLTRRTDDPASLTIGTAHAETVAVRFPETSISAARVEVDAMSYDAVASLIPADPDDGTSMKPTDVPERGIILPFDLAIESLGVTNSAVSLRDPESTEPLAINITNLNLKADQLHNDGATSATIELEAYLQTSGNLTASGSVNPFRAQPTADITLQLATLPIKPFNPVASLYLGHTVTDGRLSLDLPLTIDEAGSVNGTMQLTLDRFYLGDKVKSPHAARVPVKLGLDLLRDSNEQITASIGLSGNMNDPSFRFGNLVWDAFLNLLLKTTTAPFRLLGSIFGGGDDMDVSFVSFTPGAPRLADDSVSKLDVIARGLNDRPAMRVTLTALTGTPTDRIAMQDAFLRQLIRNDNGTPNAAPGSLTDDEYNAGLRRLYTRRIGGALPEGTAALRAALLDTVTIDEDALQKLASERLDRVLTILTTEMGVARDRLEILTEPAGDRDLPHVVFGLQQ